MNKRIYNFSAGPATLPLEILDTAQTEFTDYHNLGASIIEMSHRSKEFLDIINAARNNIKELLELDNNYQVLFLQGGASSQFYMVPMNLLSANETADYIDTGVWSNKAIKEATLFGTINTIFSSKNTNYNRVPQESELSFSENSKYVYLTSNNTIYGTQYSKFPKIHQSFLVGDFSSDILSRKIDISDFGIIFAGAQKNLGPAGVTIVIIRNDILDQCKGGLPTMLSYKTHADKESLFNTPPMFCIYMLNLNLEWLKKNGGLLNIERINTEKAALIYNEIDKNDFYTGPATIDSRSNMNITFTLPSSELEIKFIEEAKKENLYNLKGHRSVGGIRASIYNAMPIEGAHKLADFMKKFAASNS